jgi:hypothetical protein
MTHFLKGYRTILFNVAVILVGLADLIELINLIEPGYEPLLLALAGIGNVILRYLTDTSIGSNQVTTDNNQVE